MPHTTHGYPDPTSDSLSLEFHLHPLVATGEVGMEMGAVILAEKAM
jgi:hypothetical protein